MQQVINVFRTKPSYWIRDKNKVFTSDQKIIFLCEKKLLLASTNYFNYLIVFINISPIKCDFVTLENFVWEIFRRLLCKSAMNSNQIYLHKLSFENDNYHYRN